MIENKELKLSVIVPVYNVEQYIRPCIESIFKQGLDDSEFEVILVNDGTEDNSLKVISDIIAGHENIKVLEQDNQGPSVARNYGIRNAVGKYVLFIDADDLLIENSVPELLLIAINEDADLVVCDYLRLEDEEIAQNKYTTQHFDKILKKTGVDLYLEDLDPYQCYVWRIFYKNEFLLDKSLSFAFQGLCFEDIPFVQECYLKANVCIRVNQLMYIYRIGHNSITSSMNERKMMDLNQSLVRLWALQTMPGLSAKVCERLETNFFATFSFELWCISHNPSILSDWRVFIEDLQKKIPNLNFKSGFKRRFVSWMFWKYPGAYLKLRSLKFLNFFS